MTALQDIYQAQNTQTNGLLSSNKEIEEYTIIYSEIRKRKVKFCGPNKNMVTSRLTKKLLSFVKTEEGQIGGNLIIDFNTKKL